MVSREYYIDYCRRFKKVWTFLKSKSYPEDKVIRKICDLRDYDYVRMEPALKKVGFVYLMDNNVDELLSSKDDLGLINSEGNFRLLERFIFPVRDMLGNVIALIGWYPDSKKYITTPSAMFSKQCLFFGLEQMTLSGTGKPYFLVEGIFDSISLRSVGFNSVAVMGINSSRYQQAMYSMFKRLVAIPDNDEEGRDVYLRDTWKLPMGSSYVSWKNMPFKDIDDFVKNYDEEDVKELLQDVWKEKKRIISIEL